MLPSVGLREVAEDLRAWRAPGARSDGRRAASRRFTPPGRELVVIDTDGLETLCASPEEAIAHMCSLIEDLAVRLAREYPDQDELPAGMLANVERIDGEIPPGGMRVPLFHDSTTDT